MTLHRYSFTLSDISYLLALAEHGSYGRAGAALECGRSTVYAAAGRLSALVEAPVWKDGLTEEGAALIERAKPLIEAADELERSFTGQPLSRTDHATTRAGRLTPTQLRVAAKVVEQSDADGCLKAGDIVIARSIGATTRTVSAAIDVLCEAGVISRLKKERGVRIRGWMRVKGPLRRLTGGVVVPGIPVAPMEGGPVGVVTSVDWTTLRCTVRWPHRAFAMSTEELMRRYGRVTADDLLLPRPVGEACEKEGGRR